MQQEECFPRFWSGRQRDRADRAPAREWTGLSSSSLRKVQGMRILYVTIPLSEAGSVYGFPLCFPKEVGAGLCTRGR